MPTLRYSDPMTTTTKNPVIDTMLRQIGWSNVAAISGLRFTALDDYTVSLPVSHGYSVEVTLTPMDVYECRLVLTRRPKAGPADWHPAPVSKVKKVVGNVYADQLGDVAYRLSCWRDR